MVDPEWKLEERSPSLSIVQRGVTAKRQGGFLIDRRCAILGGRLAEFFLTDSYFLCLFSLRYGSW